MAIKKKITIGVFLLAILAIAVTFFIYITPSRAGTIQRDFKEPINQRGTIGIKGSKGECLTFKYSSDLKEGDLEFLILDSEENVIGTFRENISDQQIVFEKDDTYTIVALSESLVGKFKLKVYKK